MQTCTVGIRSAAPMTSCQVPAATRTVRVRMACLVGLMTCLLSARLQAAETSTPSPLTWHTDYVQAMKLAREEGKMLFVFFHNPEGDKAKQMFEERSLADEQVTKALGSFV